MKTASTGRIACLITVLFGLLLARAEAQSARTLYAANFSDGSVAAFPPRSEGRPSVFTSGLSQPDRLAFDTAGNLYVTEPNAQTIIKLTPDGASTVFASGFGLPTDLAFDAAGNLYVATAQGTIVRFAPNGTRSVFASTGLDSPVALAFDPAGNLFVGDNGNATILKITPAGTVSFFVHQSSPYGLVFNAAGNLFVADTNDGIIEEYTPDGFMKLFASGLSSPFGLAFDELGNLYVANYGSNTIEQYAPDGTATYFAGRYLSGPIGLAFAPADVPPSTFFTGEAALSKGVYYLSFSSGNPFGYYSYFSDPRYIYHFDLGYEYVFDAADGKSGVYLYDFKSGTFFYTSPTFPFPYLYDFTLNTVLYYYPDPSNAGHYNTGGVRYFYDFATGKIISK